MYTNCKILVSDLNLNMDTNKAKMGLLIWGFNCLWFSFGTCFGLLKLSGGSLVSSNLRLGHFGLGLGV